MGYAPILQDGGFRKIGKGRLPLPRDLSRAANLSIDYDAEFVKINGRLLDQSQRVGYRTLTMQLGSLIFTGRLEEKAVTDRVRAIREGSQLQLTGVWSVETDEYHRPAACRVLLRSATDSEVLKAPSLWTGQRIIALLAVLAGVILLGSLWVAVLRPRVEEKTETLHASLESTADGADMDGLMLARAIRARSELNGVLMTTQDQQLDPEVLEPAGIVASLRKPIRLGVGAEAEFGAALTRPGSWLQGCPRDGGASHDRDYSHAANCRTPGAHLSD